MTEFGGFGGIPTSTRFTVLNSPVRGFPTLYPLNPLSSTSPRTSLATTPSVASNSLSSPLPSHSSPTTPPTSSPLSSPLPTLSPNSSSATKIGLGLGLGLGIPLLLMTAGILFLWRRPERTRTTPVPNAGYTASDAIPNSPTEKKTVFAPVADAEGVGEERDRTGTPELHGEHIAPYAREMPGTPGSHRSELP